MQLVTKGIALDELKSMALNKFDELVKAVVDSEKEIMMVSAECHADQERVFLDSGSDQGNLWGINLYPYKFGTDGFIQFDSMINMRPSWGNRTRGVDDVSIQKKIIEIVNGLVIV